VIPLVSKSSLSFWRSRSSFFTARWGVMVLSQVVFFYSDSLPLPLSVFLMPLPLYSFSYKLLSLSPPFSEKTTIFSWSSEGFLQSDFVSESASHFERKFFPFNFIFLVFVRGDFVYRFCIVAMRSTKRQLLWRLFIFIFLLLKKQLKIVGY
jgi:hypothetical protein